VLPPAVEECPVTFVVGSSQMDRDVVRLCHACQEEEREGKNDKLLLCDGNCGYYWHPTCVNFQLDQEGEFYCSTCRETFETLESSLNPCPLDNNHVKEELNSLKRALCLMQKDRDQLEHQCTFEKELFDFADRKKTDVHRYFSSMCDLLVL